MGCPAVCLGYQLMQNLDFDTDGDGNAGSSWDLKSYGFEGFIMESNGYITPT